MEKNPRVDDKRESNNNQVEVANGERQTLEKSSSRGNFMLPICPKRDASMLPLYFLLTPKTEALAEVTKA